MTNPTTNKIYAKRKPNADLRPREYLTPDEVQRLVKAASQSKRNALRNVLMIELTYRHGLRNKETLRLRWDQIDLTAGVIHITHRSKKGLPSVQPLQGHIIRKLRAYRRQCPPSPFIFLHERQGTPLSPDAFQKFLKQIGQRAQFEFPIHPHMLRHATGYKLANEGHDTRAIQQYLGHNNIQHTVRYTELCPNRFKDFWRD